MRKYSLSLYAASSPEPEMLRLCAVESDLGVVVAAFLSAPTFAVWILAFLNAVRPSARTTMPPRGAWRAT